MSFFRGFQEYKFFALAMHRVGRAMNDPKEVPSSVVFHDASERLAASFKSIVSQAQGVVIAVIAMGAGAVKTYCPRLQVG